MLTLRKSKNRAENRRKVVAEKSSTVFTCGTWGILRSSALKQKIKPDAKKLRGASVNMKILSTNTEII